MSELGNKLRDARVEKGYTLNTLQQMTKIQKKYLQAIEQGDYEEMPGIFYVRAFIKQYADTVGLDGDRLLESYEEEITTNVKKEDSTPVTEVDDLPSRSQKYEDKVSGQWDKLVSFLPMAALIAVIIAIMVALLFAIQSLNQTDEDTAASSSQEEVALVSVVEPASVSSSQEPQSTTESVEETQEGDMRVGSETLSLDSVPGEITTYSLNGPAANYSFEITGISYVWVGIFEDDVITVDTTITEGETLDYTIPDGVSNVRITFGYAEGASVNVNGTVVEPQGQYLTEQMVFTVPDDYLTTAAPAETAVTEEGYQGPAVYDTTTDGTE